MGFLAGRASPVAAFFGGIMVAEILLDTGEGLRELSSERLGKTAMDTTNENGKPMTTHENG